VAKHDLAPSPQVDRLILTLRGHRVLLDLQLAPLYGVDVKVLNQAVKRNPQRFPADFMFKLTDEEAADLRSQIVTSSCGGRRYRVPVTPSSGLGIGFSGGGGGGGGCMGGSFPGCSGVHATVWPVDEQRNLRPLHVATHA
jgi:hypothetical protein